MGKPKGMPKSGGRKPGVPNRRTQEVAELLKRLNCDPLKGMAQIAQDEAVDIAIRAKVFMELAEYLFSKPKAISVDLTANESYEERLRRLRGLQEE